VSAGRILAGLDPEQRRAVEAVRGPVVILAGAGSGKTTTITHRIAYQVATGAFAPEQILAVTFTDRAATELRERLATLGVDGVVARTFHATALRQLTFLEPSVGGILPTKALWLRQIGNTLPKPFRFRPAADLATEVEWAKNRRLTPETYRRSLGEHEPPISADLMERVFRRYEERKRSERRIDFEDVLELLVRTYEARPEAIERFRARCRAITVDEYQDVNLLQQTLLDLWLGDRNDLCVVGDDYQSIFSFTGASAEHLLGARTRFEDATIVRLERNYRSTPQILELANRLVPQLGGAQKVLRATRPGGPPPELRSFAASDDQVAWIVERLRALGSSGVAWEEIAVLYRVNARSEEFEAPLAAAGIPFQVIGGAFLDRPAARGLLRRLRGSREPALPAVQAAAREAGLLEQLSDDLGQEELTRQSDLRRLVELAVAAEEDSTGADFVADLERRFRSDGSGRGVQLLTLHRAKGLEFEAVFVPFLQEGELPIRQAKSAEAIAEERRLLYVGLTRAKRVLSVTWSTDRPASRFLVELGVQARTRPQRKQQLPAEQPPAFRALRDWRRERAQTEEVPAFVVFSDATLHELADRLPRTPVELASVPGIGPVKLERYGDDVLRVLRPFGR
jgi:DNA helicase-2/ATP-dependent DNA helicase PcrA